MVFRVVEKSSAVFETDLPPSTRNIHPSGVMYAVRRDLSGPIGREVHVFVWVDNSLDAEPLLNHLEQRGFDRSSNVVFIPYSTKANWLRNYPHIQTMECDEDGRIVWPSAVPDRILQAERAWIDVNEDDDGGFGNGNVERKKHGSGALLPGPERVELHIEIYKYLEWLHDKLAGLARKEKYRKAIAVLARERGWDVEGINCGGNEDEKEGNDVKQETDDEEIVKAADVSVPDLKGALDKLESAFHIDTNHGGDDSLSGSCGAARGGTPFLEEELAPALARLAEERKQGGRQELRPPPVQGGHRGYNPEKFDIMFAKMETYKERMGHCRIPGRISGLGSWVKTLRERRNILIKKGIEFERVTPEQPLFGRMLTAERILRLDAIGFVWKGERGKNIGGAAAAAAGGRSSLPRSGDKRYNPEKFDIMYDELKAFKEEHGHCRVPDGRGLGSWVKILRGRRNMLIKKGIEFEKVTPEQPLFGRMLTAERIVRLDSLGFVWSLKVPWEERFRQVTDYFKKEGKWPHQGQSKAGVLGVWVKRQRLLYAKQDETFMKDKYLKLEEVGFEWIDAEQGPAQLVDKSEKQPRYDPENFDAMFEKMARYKEEHGHCHIPTDDSELGSWVRKLRKRRRAITKKGFEFEGVTPKRPLTGRMLTAERIKRLDSIGFLWEVGLQPVSWEARFHQLMNHYEKHGKWPAQQYDGGLQGWVYQQRALYAKKDEEFMKTRYPKLEEAGFEWTVGNYGRIKWEQGFEMLMDFFRTNGHFNVPCPAGGELNEDGTMIDRKSDAYKFYSWVESLHAYHRLYEPGPRANSGMLNKKRISLLKEHGFKFRD